MKLHIAMLAATLLLSGGASYAQGNKQEKKAKAYMVADAHLDTQWNWDVQTTIKEYVWNTINQNLFLLKKYPNYVFNFEGGVKYAWMKEYYPAQYEEMKKYIDPNRERYRFHVRESINGYSLQVLIVTSGENVPLTPAVAAQLQLRLPENYRLQGCTRDAAEESMKELADLNSWTEVTE